MRLSRAAALAVVSLVVSSALPALAGDFEIGNYTLISSKRITRTVYENVYKADVSNRGDAAVALTATLSSTASQISVVEGTLSFDEVPVDGMSQSSDTFTVRHDRSLPFDESALIWATQTAPLPPTSIELIDQALTGGVIGEETALVYKVYAEFDDDQLPTAYRGRKDRSPEASALTDASEQFETLSSTTQELLAPYLLPPNEAGSWYQLRLGQQSVSSSAISKPIPVGDSAPPSAWQYTDRTHVRVWWDPGLHPEDQTRANVVATEVERIWPQLTGLLGTPVSDLGSHVRTDPHDPSQVAVALMGGDPRLDLMIVDEATISVAAGDKESTAVNSLYNGDPCRDHGGNPSFILITSTTTIATIAHEVAHSALRSLDTQGGCGNLREYRWMNEATAQWVEHFIYPEGRVKYPAGNKGNTEQSKALDFLNHPNLELESLYKDHRYGAYLWFFYATRGGTASPDVVRKTWDAAATHDSLAAIKEGVADRGEFADQWSQFELYNWNQERSEKGPYRYYATWDQLDAGAKETTGANHIVVQLNGHTSITVPLYYAIPHLAANYFHFDFGVDDKIRRVTFSQPNQDGYEPKARVQAIMKVRGQKWREAEDWTRFPRKTLCFDRPTEDVEELVIVISNGEFTDRTDVLRSVDVLGSSLTELKASAVGCKPFVGTVEFNRTIQQDSPPYKVDMTETAVTNVTFDPVDDSVIPNLYPDYVQLYRILGGSSVWTHVGSFSTPGETCSGGGSGLVGVVPTDENPNSPHLYLYIGVPPPLGDRVSTFYEAFGRVDTSTNSMSTTYSCSPSAESEIPFGYGDVFDWLKVRPNEDQPLLMYPTATTDQADGGVVLEGEYSDQDGDLETTLYKRKWHWRLKQQPKTP